MEVSDPQEAGEIELVQIVTDLELVSPHPVPLHGVACREVCIRLVEKLVLGFVVSVSDGVIVPRTALRGVSLPYHRNWSLVDSLPGMGWTIYGGSVLKHTTS